MLSPEVIKTENGEDLRSPEHNLPSQELIPKDNKITEGEETAVWVRHWYLRDQEENNIMKVTKNLY